MNCRHCAAPLTLTFIDLGSAPPSNAYLTERDLKRPERWFPLRVLVCSECRLVQTEDYAGANEIFTEDYAYFSSFSTTWLDHCKNYVDTMTERFRLDSHSLVVELAANDGYLLQYVAARNIPCIGIEPTASTAASARQKGIEIIEKFFGVSLAQEMTHQGHHTDLLVANNVLAHVPDVNDFVSAVAVLLKLTGVATFEFPHFPNLVVHNQFDTIYHEHYSYLSLLVVMRIFASNGLSVFDVEELPTHGGSLRVYAQRKDGPHPLRESVTKLIERERSAGLLRTDYYTGFQARANQAKSDFLMFLLQAKHAGRKVAAYGAAAKGNTLLNYAGVRPDLIPYVVDKNPSKQGKFLPGSRIPIASEDRIRAEQPDYIVVLPWNIRKEVMSDLAYAREWGAQFVTAIPQLRVA